MGETTRQAFADELHKIDVKLEKGDDDKTKKTDGGQSGANRQEHMDDDTSNDSIEEIPGNFNEIIVLDDTEREQLEANDQPSHSASLLDDDKDTTADVPGMGCKDCEKVRQFSENFCFFFGIILSR